MPASSTSIAAMMPMIGGSPRATQIAHTSAANTTAIKMPTIVRTPFLSLKRVPGSARIDAPFRTPCPDVEGRGEYRPAVTPPPEAARNRERSQPRSLRAAFGTGVLRLRRVLLRRFLVPATLTQEFVHAV